MREPDEILEALREDLGGARADMRAAWGEHLEALKSKDRGEIAFTRRRYNNVEARFERAMTLLERRGRLLMNELSTGDAVVLVGPPGEEVCRPKRGRVAAIRREFRVLKCAGRKRAEMQNRYIVATAEGEESRWMDELEVVE